MFQSLRSSLAPFSPRRWLWKRFLASRTLEVAKLPRPLTPPGPRDVVLCGCPRSGTTLLAGMLFQPPHSVVVMEPWDGMRLEPAKLFADLRREISETGQLTRGKLDVDALRQQRRVRWTTEGKKPVPLTLEPESILGVKWPAYWQLLPDLPATKFLVCLRHPFELVGSFAKQAGRLAEGLEYDIAFNRDLNTRLLAATPDPMLRRALFVEEVHRGILPFLQQPNVLAIRYERWFTEPEKLWGEIQEFLGVELPERPVELQPGTDRDELSESEKQVLREHCPSAWKAGYARG